MFDSDFDSTDMSVSDGGDTLDNDDIEFLDTDDVQDTTDNIVEQQSDNLSDSETYKANRMTEEQVQEIDALWNSEQHDDVEPYQATHLTEEQMKQTDEIWEEKSTKDIPEPYKATSLDPIDDVSTAGNGDSVFDFGSQSLEERFAAEVDAMSLDDLCKEHERIASLSEMDDLDVFSEFDNTQKAKYDPELFAALTDGLSKESLKQLRNGLAAGDPDTYEYFGLNGETDDENGEYSRARRK